MSVRASSAQQNKALPDFELIEGLATTRPLSRTPDVKIRKRFFFVSDAWTIMPWNGLKPSIISARKEPKKSGVPSSN